MQDFSVGLSIKLSELTKEQVYGLAQRHGLNWSSRQGNQLIALVGGNPYLVQVVSCSTFNLHN